MRTLPSPSFALLLAFLLVCSTGASCAHSLRNPFASFGPQAPQRITPAATLDEVVYAVNQNAGRIQQFQTNNASISVPGTMGLPLMTGRLAAERPRRLRLRASAGVMGPLVDLGSNDELFWFWVRQNQPPGVYFARHDEFAGGAAHRALPIEPEWLLDALGFAELRPGDAHQGPVPLGDGTLEVTTVMQRPSGPVTRRMVIDASSAWVLQQHFYDANQNPLASAVARAHKYYPDLDVSLPQKIDIQMPMAELSLSIDVGDPSINNLAPNPQLWQMPVIEGAPPIDVGAGVVDPQAPAVGRRMLQTAWDDPTLPVGVPPQIDASRPQFAGTPATSGNLINTVPGAPGTANGGVVQRLRQTTLPPVTTDYEAPGAAGNQLPPGGIATQPIVGGAGVRR